MAADRLSLIIPDAGQSFRFNGAGKKTFTSLAGRPLYLQTTGSDGLSRRVRAGRELNVTISEELAGELVELVGRDRVGLVRL